MNIRELMIQPNLPLRTEMLAVQAEVKNLGQKKFRLEIKQGDVHKAVASQGDVKAEVKAAMKAVPMGKGRKGRRQVAAIDAELKCCGLDPEWRKLDLKIQDLKQQIESLESKAEDLKKQAEAAEDEEFKKSLSQFKWWELDKELERREQSGFRRQIGNSIYIPEAQEREQECFHEALDPLLDGMVERMSKALSFNTGIPKERIEDWRKSIKPLTHQFPPGPKMRLEKEVSLFGGNLDEIKGRQIKPDYVVKRQVKWDESDVTHWQDFYDMANGDLLQKLKQFIRRIPEFAYSPVFMIVDSPPRPPLVGAALTLRFMGGGSFTFDTKALGIILPIGASAGQTVGIDVEAVKKFTVGGRYDSRAMIAEPV